MPEKSEKTLPKITAENPGRAPGDLMEHMQAGTLQLSALPPLSLYVHFPWCVKKCPYCDFNSHGLKHFEGSHLLSHQLDEKTQRDYVAALIADVESCLPLIWGRTVSTIFMGGGTPSLFAPEIIDEFLSAMRARLRLEADCEITLEANPSTLERGHFRDYRRAGVTRLSLGVQSFHDDLLAQIGRVHNGAQAFSAAQEAASVFETFNIDLMYALPGQTLDMLRHDVETAFKLHAPHISIYHLSIEPNTYFAKYPPKALEQEGYEDLAWDMLDYLTQSTAAAGLQRYEVSAYARAGHRCAHNINYWQFGDYLGIGAGAHGKLSFAHRIIRQVRLRDPALYMQGALSGRALASETVVPRRDVAFEYILGALRLLDGFSLRHFMETTGLPRSILAQPLEKAQALQLVEIHNDVVRPTARGLDFLSDLQALFLPETSKTPSK